MPVRIDGSGYRTLKLFLLSCHSTLGDNALYSFFKYSGDFPVDSRETLGDFAWVVEELPENVFVRLEEYANKNNLSVITDKEICLFFGGQKHLETAKKSCILYNDLSQEERTAGHLSLPIRVTDILEDKISGEVIYNGLTVKNVFNPFSDVELGDIVIVHFATVVLASPSQDLLDKLTFMQKDFVKNELSKVKKLHYSSTLKETKKKAEKYLDT